MRTSTICLLALFLGGCAGLDHLVIGRQNLYFDGDMAENDLFIQGDALAYIKEHGQPDFYKWDKLSRGLKTAWFLNLYYGKKTMIFAGRTGKKLFGERDTWTQETMMSKGFYPRTDVIVDRNSTPYKYYTMEKK